MVCSLLLLPSPTAPALPVPKLYSYLNCPYPTSFLIGIDPEQVALCAGTANYKAVAALPVLLPLSSSRERPGWMLLRARGKASWHKSNCHRLGLLGINASKRVATAGSCCGLLELPYIRGTGAPSPGGSVPLQLPRAQRSRLTWTTTNIACTMG